MNRRSCKVCVYSEQLTSHSRFIGSVVLDKALFSSYRFRAPTPADEDEDADTDLPVFQISLDALLETLQIFGVNDMSRDSGWGGVAARPFDNRVLGTAGTCRFSYDGEGSKFCVTLEESNIITTCKLSTYVPDPVDDIPFQRDAIALKIIMRASWLHDAVTELSATSPERLTMIASQSAPYFTLSSNGSHGSAVVEFSKDQQLLETFQVGERVVNTYKYSMIKGASRAMAMAAKVSIRGDEQGVLNLQFMIEMEAGSVSFVDFSFVAFIPEEGDDEGEDEEEDENDMFDG